MGKTPLRWYCSDPAYKELVADICSDVGYEDAINMLHREDVSWGGGYVLLVSDGVDTFEDIVTQWPESRFFVVGSPIYWTAPNLVQLADLIEARNKLIALLGPSPQEAYVSCDEPEKRKRRARRLARRFADCVYCGKPISIIGFSIASHEKKCRIESTRRPARGRMLTAYQVCGKSKGSLLVLEILEDLVTKNFSLAAGTHIISDRKLIRKINAELPSYFNYELESDVEDDRLRTNQ